MIPILNNEERRQWVNNDEGLYNWWKSERCSMTIFIKNNKNDIDACIKRALGGQQS